MSNVVQYGWICPALFHCPVSWFHHQLLFCSCRSNEKVKFSCSQIQELQKNSTRYGNTPSTLWQNDMNCATSYILGWFCIHFNAAVILMLFGNVTILAQLKGITCKHVKTQLQVWVDMPIGIILVVLLSNDSTVAPAASSNRIRYLPCSYCQCQNILANY